MNLAFKRNNRCKIKRRILINRLREIISMKEDDSEILVYDLTSVYIKYLSNLLK